MSTPVRGDVERVNDRGLCISGEWYNYSKWIKQRASEGDLVEFEVKQDDKGTQWIQSIKFLKRAPEEVSQRDRRITRVYLISSAVEMLKIGNGKKPANTQDVKDLVLHFEDFVYGQPNESEDVPF